MIRGYTATTPQQMNRAMSNTQVRTGQNTDVGTPPTALWECTSVCVCVCVCVCQCMNYTWYWSLLASLLDDSNGDSDLLDQSDEQDEQNEKYECTKDTCNEG